MTAVVVRIALRYIAGFLVAKGLVTTDLGAGLASDPDVLNVMTILAGFVLGGIAEGFYWLARRFGWGT
jgi:hypothetical protein